MVASIQSLPECLLIEAFSFLDVKTLGRCCQVSKEWQLFGSSDVLWKKTWSLEDPFPYGISKDFKKRLDSIMPNKLANKKILDEWGQAKEVIKKEINVAPLPHYYQRSRELSNANNGYTMILQVADAVAFFREGSKVSAAISFAGFSVCLALQKDPTISLIGLGSSGVVWLITKKMAGTTDPLAQQIMDSCFNYSTRKAAGITLQHLKSTKTK